MKQQQRQGLQKSENSLHQGSRKNSQQKSDLPKQPRKIQDRQRRLQILELHDCKQKE